MASDASFLESRILETLFPVRCAGCGSPGAPLCGACQPELDQLILDPPADGDREGASAAFRYEGIARTLVLGLKVRHLRPYARPLAAALAKIVQREAGPERFITWVPARGRARRERGFDQAELLAREVAAWTGLRAVGTLAAAPKADQVGLGRLHRAANAHGAFFPSRRSLAAGAPLLLIDDLITTGSTVRACTAALRRAGWGEVRALAACRA